MYSTPNWFFLIEVCHEVSYKCSVVMVCVPIESNVCLMDVLDRTIDTNMRSSFHPSATQFSFRFRLTKTSTISCASLDCLLRRSPTFRLNFICLICMSSSLFSQTLSKPDLITSCHNFYFFFLHGWIFLFFPPVRLILLKCIHYFFYRKAEMLFFLPFIMYSLTQIEIN